VRHFASIGWYGPGIVGSTADPIMSEATMHMISKQAMEKGFQTAQGQLEGLRMVLELLPDDPPSNPAAALSVSSQIPPPNEWLKLPNRQRAIANYLINADGSVLPFRTICEWNGSAESNVAGACRSLKEGGFLDFPGNDPIGQVITFTGHAKKEAAERRVAMMALEPLSEDELALLDKLFDVCPHIRSEGNCFGNNGVSAAGFDLGFDDEKTRSTLATLIEKDAVQNIDNANYAVTKKGRSGAVDFRKLRARIGSTSVVPTNNFYGPSNLGTGPMQVDQNQNINHAGTQAVVGGNQIVGDGNALGDRNVIDKSEPEPPPKWFAKMATKTVLGIISAMVIAAVGAWLKYKFK
jgi:hypothetical protein